MLTWFDGSVKQGVGGLLWKSLSLSSDIGWNNTNPTH